MNIRLRLRERKTLVVFFLYILAASIAGQERVATIPVQEATLYKLFAQTRHLPGPARAKATIHWQGADGKLLRSDRDELGPSETVGSEWRQGLFMSPLGAARAEFHIRILDDPGGLAAEASLYQAYALLDNSLIRVGVNGTLGGAIDYLADSQRPGKNYVNHHDPGRLIVKSFWGPPYAYYWPGYEPADRFPWNPIQSGFWEKEKKIYSGALEFDILDGGRTVYTKCRPVTFPAKSRLDPFPEVTETLLETWVTIMDSTPAVGIASTYRNQDRVDHSQWRDQEALAVYVTTDLSRLWTYDGPAPFTGAPLSLRPTPLTPVASLVTAFDVFAATESWAAWTDSTGFGVGAFVQEVQPVISFKYGAQGIADDGAEEANEFSFIPRFSIPPESVRRDRAWVILGSLEEIRSFVYRAESGHQDQSGPLSWEFSEPGDRQGWSGGWIGPWDGGTNAVDDRPGVQDGQWMFSSIPGINPWIISPHFQASSSLDTVEVRLAATGSGSARILWNRLIDPLYDFAPERSVDFPLVPDGAMHTYSVSMANRPSWSGIVRQLLISGFASGQAQVKVDYVRITRGTSR